VGESHTSSWVAKNPSTAPTKKYDRKFWILNFKFEFAPWNMWWWWQAGTVATLGLGLLVSLVTKGKNAATFQSTRQQREQQQQQPPSVLILGGGLSGLAAARTLLNASEWNSDDLSKAQLQVTLLESKDRLGGRVHSVDMETTIEAAAGDVAVVAVDLGGMYWHGESPVLQQLRRDFSDWQTISTGGTSMHPAHGQAVWMMRATTGKPETNNVPTMDNSSASVVESTASYHYSEMSSAQIAQAQSLFQDWVESMEASYRAHVAAADANATAATKSPPELLQEWSDLAFASVCRNSTIHADTNGGNDTSIQEHQHQEQYELHEAWLRFQLVMTFELDHGLALTEHALAGLANDWDWIEYAGDDPVSVKGMSNLVDLLAEDVRKRGGRIVTNQRVERVVYSDKSEKNEPSTRCRVTTAQGVEYEADVCIVTLPLGVLKATAADMFVPPLPAVKQSALDRAEVGVLNTVVVQWNRPICQPNATAYYLMGGTAATRSDSNAKVDQLGKNPLRHGFICTGMLRGRNPAVTQFYFGETNHPFNNRTYWKEQAWKVVRDVVPFSISMDDITDLMISQWHLDPDIRGSYSAPGTFTDGNLDRKLLAEPIDNVLYFAGEHTHYTGRYQSMDGAYTSGERAAQNALVGLRARWVERKAPVPRAEAC
jgi:monoamine oxidase